MTTMRKYRKRRFAPNFSVSLFFWFFEGVPQALHASACLKLWFWILMLCPRRSGFETRKSLHSRHQVPKQLPVILGMGRSKPSLRYPKGSVTPPPAPLPTPPPRAHPPPPKKKTQIFGTSPDTLSPKCFMHLARFSGQPQKIRDNLKTAEKGCP